MQISVMGPRYLTVTMDTAKNLEALHAIFKAGGTLYVKQRAGHLSYAEDPKVGRTFSSSFPFPNPLKPKLRLKTTGMWGLFMQGVSSGHQIVDSNANLFVKEVSLLYALHLCLK